MQSFLEKVKFTCLLTVFLMKICPHISNWFLQFCHSVWHASSCHDTKGWSTCDAAMKPEAGPGYGLCNGTRMIVLTLGQRVVEVEISSGVNRGNHILIPHITIAPSDTELPFTLKHCQFPLCPCFAVSTNKAQGQTLQFVGIYLPDHVFTHGQLYVAFSSYRPISSCCVLE